MGRRGEEDCVCGMYIYFSLSLHVVSWRLGGRELQLFAFVCILISFSSF